MLHALTDNFGSGQVSTDSMSEERVYLRVRGFHVKRFKTFAGDKDEGQDTPLAAMTEIRVQIHTSLMTH